MTVDDGESCSSTTAACSFAGDAQESSGPQDDAKDWVVCSLKPDAGEVFLPVKACFQDVNMAPKKEAILTYSVPRDTRAISTNVMSLKARL